jgi:hypothetical protein
MMRSSIDRRDRLAVSLAPIGIFPNRHGAAAANLPTSEASMSSPAIASAPRIGRRRMPMMENAVTEETSGAERQPAKMTELQALRDLLFEVLCSGQLDRDLTRKVQKALDGTFDLVTWPERL